jgi:hypothetical protein
MRTYNLAPYQAIANDFQYYFRFIRPIDRIKNYLERWKLGFQNPAADRSPKTIPRIKNHSPVP